MKLYRKTILIAAAAFIQTILFSQTTERIYLSGEGPSDAIEWDFYCSEGRKSGEWTSIPVPSNWEQHGFGSYDYGHVPPDEKSKETGIYKTTFFAPEEWKEKAVRIVFEGVMTETSIKVNGKPVGAPHMGGYLSFSYSLNSPNAYNNNCLKYGEENELEVKVAKKPSDESLDLAERKADYWVFGGIYRPVYIEVMPQIFINRLAIDARADGNITVDVFPQAYQNFKYSGVPEQQLDVVEAQILTNDNEIVGSTFSVPLSALTGKVSLTSKIMNPVAWSPENPQLYKLRVRIKNKDKVVHEKTELFGFRTFEVRDGDGLYLNGEKLLIRGVNRNVMHPATARSIDPEDAWNDARLIKEMNANLVRSHMPATKYFMEACDKLGLLCISELTNWQKPYINTFVARNMVHELVANYQNHPSVIIWANGNEGGFNTETDELFHLFDIQNRPIIHPYEVFEGIDTRHYPTYGMLMEKTKSNIIYLPTELLHGLYDGGLGAGLEDYWKVMSESPIAAGGVLWCWADAAVERTDKQGWLDTDGNHSADGIVGPFREKEASYFTIREIWSPVQVELSEVNSDFNGNIPVKNNFMFNSLNQCTFDYELINYKQTKGNLITAHEVYNNKIAGPDLQPAAEGQLHLDLPSDWRESDVLKLRATDPDDMVIMEWSWAIKTDRFPAKVRSKSPELRDGSTVKAGDSEWIFDENSGLLKDCLYKGVSVGLGNGPVLYYSDQKEGSESQNGWSASFKETGKGNITITSTNKNSGDTFEWTFAAGQPVELEYDFGVSGEPVTFCAVGFDLLEAAVQSKQWSGDGPYRIWGNRTKGPQFGLWQNEYNDAVPGYLWDYPAFKGIFGNVDWLQLHLKDGLNLTIDPVNVASIGVLKPANVPVREDLPNSDKNVGPRTASWDYPNAGGLYIFHKLPAVGTKFKRAEDLGPQSKPKKISNVKGKLKFIIQ